MNLVNFDDDVIETVSDNTVVISSPVPVATQVASTRPLPSASSKHMLKPVASWGWEEVRDYVVSSIETIHGPFPRNFKTEGSIFKSFCNRWGAQAGPIAQMAFTHFEGMWKGSPVSVNRFCIGSDQYFARPLADRL